MKNQKYRLMTGSPEDYPPIGSVGVYKVIKEQRVFIPDDDRHLPPDCSRQAFGGYHVEPEELELVSYSPE